jgi:hypothetical protein
MATKGSWKEKREPAPVWGGWWFWEPPPGKTKEDDTKR